MDRFFHVIVMKPVHFQFILFKRTQVYEVAHQLYIVVSISRQLIYIVYKIFQILVYLIQDKYLRSNTNLFMLLDANIKQYTGAVSV